MANPLSSSSQVSSLPEPWILGSFKIEDSPQAPKAVLDYLSTHPEFVYTYVEETQKTLARLRAIDLAKAGLSSSHWKTYTHWQKIFIKPSGNFPEIALHINERTLKVEKNRLIQRSEVLQRQAAHNTTDTVNLDDIDINCGEVAVTPATKEAFLLYLQSGILDIETADPFELLKLADKYAVDELKEKLTHILNEALSDETVLDILEASKAYSAKKLTAYCLCYAFKNLDALLVNFPEKTEMLQLLKTLREVGGALKLYLGEDHVLIRFIDWSTDHSRLLNDLCRWAELRLELIHTGHDDQSLKALLQNTPHLDHLCIRNERIKSIEGAERLKILDCKYCSSLSMLNLPAVVELSCAHCSSLSTLIAPVATKITCDDCPSLSSLNAPAVTKLSCDHCPSLSSLNVPAVTELSCDHCSSLSTLITPAVTRLNCTGCTSLITLNAPEATAITCSGCTALTTLNAPAVKGLSCYKCPLLKKDDVHVAKDCHISGLYRSDYSFYV